MIAQVGARSLLAPNAQRGSASIIGVIRLSSNTHCNPCSAIGQFQIVVDLTCQALSAFDQSVDLGFAIENCRAIQLVWLECPAPPTPPPPPLSI